MHYTGMLAAIFTPTAAEAAPLYNLNTSILGFGVGLLTLVILGLALISAIVDRRFSAKAAQLDESTKVLLESEERFRGLSEATSEGPCKMPWIVATQRAFRRRRTPSKVAPAGWLTSPLNWRRSGAWGT